MKIPTSAPVLVEKVTAPVWVRPPKGTFTFEALTDCVPKPLMSNWRTGVAQAAAPAASTVAIPRTFFMTRAPLFSYMRTAGRDNARHAPRGCEHRGCQRLRLRPPPDEVVHRGGRTTRKKSEIRLIFLY